MLATSTNINHTSDVNTDTTIAPSTPREQAELWADKHLPEEVAGEYYCYSTYRMPADRADYTKPKDCKWNDHFVSTREELIDKLWSLRDEPDTDTYVALSTYVEGGDGQLRRLAGNARRRKVIPSDFDVATPKEVGKDKSANISEAAKHAFELHAALGIKPTFVKSGRGIHTYIVLDKAYSVKDVKPVAEALKTFAKEAGYKIDPVVPADSARVLRMPGMLHRKNQKPLNVVLGDVGIELFLAEVDSFVREALRGLAGGVANEPVPAVGTGLLNGAGSGLDGLTSSLAGYDKTVDVSANRTAITSAVDYLIGKGHQEEYHSWWSVVKDLAAGARVSGTSADDVTFLKAEAVRFSQASEGWDEDGFEQKWNDPNILHGGLKNLFAVAGGLGWKNPGDDNRAALVAAGTTDATAWGVDELLTTHSKDDIAHGRLFAMAAKQRNFLFTPQGFMQYEEPRWVKSSAKPIELAKEIVDQLKHWGWGLPEETQRKAARQHYAYLSTRSGMNNMIRMAETDPRIHVEDMLSFDAHPMMFQAANGAIDLNTGELKPNSPDWRATKSSPVIYDAKATCPKWVKFLSEIFPDDPDTQESFHRWCGYSITGVVREEHVCFFLGKGQNGKSTVNRILTHILGGYRVQVADGLLLARLHDDPQAANSALVMTRGARMLAVNEVKKHARLDERAIRQVGGTEPITTRDLHEKPFTFQPTGKLYVSLNDMPLVSDMSNGLWRRLRVIPFSVTISDEEKNINLLDELLVEAPGILNWLIEGCRKWNMLGLVWSSNCLKAADIYKRDTDTLAEFMDRYEVTGNVADMVKQGEVWREYIAFPVFGESRIGKKRFYQMVAERPGIGRKHTKTGDWFTGIKAA